MEYKQILHSMAVTIVFSGVQSSDGDTITWSNDSVITAPDVLADYDWSFVLTDSAGEDLDTLEIETGELTVDYTVDKDRWINVTLNAVGSTTHTETIGHYFFRNTANKLIEANNAGCCTSKSDKENICMALRFIKGAEYAAPIGNAVAFQTNIDAANSYLDLIV